MSFFYPSLHEHAKMLLTWYLHKHEYPPVCCDELIAHGDLRFGPFSDQLIARSTVVMKHRYKGDWHNWTLHFPEFTQPVGKTGAPFGPVNIFKIAIKRIIKGKQGVACWADT